MPDGRRGQPPNARQQRFIDAYLRSDDPRAAAIAAGYAPSTARKNASALLRRSGVALVLRRELDARAERTRLAADRIVLELARVAFSDIGRIAAWDEKAGVTMRPLGELSEGDRAAVARIVRHGGHVSIALHDKIRALDALGKYFKLWGKHAETIRPDGREDRRAARAALKAKIERIIGERDGDREALQREEAEWDEAWRARFG